MLEYGLLSVFLNEIAGENICRLWNALQRAPLHLLCVLARNKNVTRGCSENHVKKNNNFERANPSKMKPKERIIRRVSVHIRRAASTLTTCALLLLVSLLHAQRDTLTITTFNCEFLNERKVHIKFDENNPGREWEDADFRHQRFVEASAAVADFLATFDSDVLVLTEVGNQSEMKLLQQQLKDRGQNYPYLRVCESADRGTGQYVAILSRLEITEAVLRIPGREFYIAEEDDPAEEIKDTGISKGMRVVVKSKGREFIIYGAHLISERLGPEDDFKRLAQASILRRHMLDDLQHGKYIIIAGDFNDHRGQPPLRRLRGLDDIFEDFIQTGYTRYFDKDKYDTRWTYQYMGERQQIDHILVSLSLKEACLQRKGIRTWTTAPEPAARRINNRTVRVSDHRALTVQLIVR
ncbi:MAG TPA: endonuclease/exonuclease/phosphatase family protein [Phaeodactylibacter sp.]|nr:endonuclease/exonuclease/phosphatase family protein [Phaeodactylibacter sp.]